ncbi:uncharacterized protein LOC119738348 isoform X2 [Patiria miniata]|uniref:EGF-like domain-containing protein n=1 Tax=Patiria miniata TaxID=46514 RepID=A0A914AZN7_PATMI|nr:uncharacterized protein LOC119738348 isoform X2 [Patiria miniata]
MQLTADYGVLFVCLFVIVLASGAASERKRVVLELDHFTYSTEVPATGSVSSGSTGRSKLWRLNDTGGKGRGGAATTRHKPREDIREPTAYRHDSTHCMNGGTGFLRSFCFCKAEYTGRYCEHRVNGSCDAVNHGDWVYRNCSYCLCVDGVFECRRHELEGCREEPETPKHHNYLEDSVALEMHPHRNGCIPQRSSSLVPLMTLVVLVHRILWLQNTSVR